MNNYYIVRFILADCGPDEEYYYPREEDAITHYNLFLDDDSGLYRRIQIEYNDQILKIQDPG